MYARSLSLLIRRSFFTTPPKKTASPEAHELVLLLKDRFTTISWTREKMRDLLPLMKELLTVLSLEEMKSIIRHSATLDMVMALKANLIDALVSANIVDDFRTLFREEAQVIYENEQYFKCLTEICDYLKQKDQLTTPNLMLFLAQEDCLKYFEFIKTALALLETRNLASDEKALFMVCHFPKQAPLIASLLVNWQSDATLKEEMNESGYYALINTYFAEHREDVSKLGFEFYLKQYQRDQKELYAKEKEQSIWRSASQLWCQQEERVFQQKI